MGQDDEEETTTVVVKMTARLDEIGGFTTSRMERAISKRLSWAPSVHEVIASFNSTNYKKCAEISFPTRISTGRRKEAP